MMNGWYNLFEFCIHLCNEYNYFRIEKFQGNFLETFLCESSGTQFYAGTDMF